MAPTVILIRHAQAEHNASKDYNIPDPPLTPHGLNTQCSELASFLQDSLPLAQRISLIVTSPLERTLQTTHAALGWLIDRGVPVMARADWQESSDKPCDTGSSPDVLAARWPRVDWSTLDPVFPDKTGLYEYSRAALLRRGALVRAWLRAREEPVIAVVSHAAFMSLAVSHRHYMNADLRIFDFADAEAGAEEEEEEVDTLVEWELSERQGGARGLSFKGEAWMAKTEPVLDVTSRQV